ncbi:hypothetical protein DRH27_04695, partial [Candidatus Falkowbacteria bacterium]
VWFQPMHHGGCLQVCEEKQPDQNQKYLNLFIKSSSGRKTFVGKLGINNAAFLLPADWLDALLKSKRTSLTATVTVDGKSRSVLYGMKFVSKE